jgi:hypothetical protein
VWPRSAIPAGYREPVRSSVPALIFSGNLDPVTPPERGEEVAHYLPNSRHIVVAEAGHGLEGLTNAGCLDKLIIEFMDKADTRNSLCKLRRTNEGAALRDEIVTPASW